MLEKGPAGAYDGGMRIHFTALFRGAAGTSEADIALEQPVNFADLTRILSDRFGPEMHRLLAHDDGADVVLAVNGRVVPRGQHPLLRDEDDLTLLMPLAGG